MNRDAIVAHLLSTGYEVSLAEDGSGLVVQFEAGGRAIKLAHVFPERITSLPSFMLLDCRALGTLAHVLVSDTIDHGIVCVANQDSISVNFEVPELAYRDSLERHISLLRPLIENPDWNRAELLREFHANWEIMCARNNPTTPSLFFAGDTITPFALQVMKPRSKSKRGLRGNYLALPTEDVESDHFRPLRHAGGWRSRELAGKGIVVTLRDFDPAPVRPLELVEWYLDALDRLCADDAIELDRFRNQLSRELWIVFRAPTSTGMSSVAIRFRTKNKKKRRRLPTSVEECESWMIVPIHVRPVSRETLVPRGGGALELNQRSVLLVGCGSVGSEIAHRLASAGLGRLTIADPDMFREENLFRHPLSMGDIDYPKSDSLAVDLLYRYPGIDVTPSRDALSAWEDQTKLESFDLIVVAVGAPTAERIFHNFVRESGIGCPVVNSWVEAFGVGGHATLDLPTSKGCLLCAYVDPKELGRGLASNLNFLEPNQDITTTNAGCGSLFLPYNGVAAGYTATMTADLSVRSLQGVLDRSSKVSWKGSAIEAERGGFTTSHRFHQFEKTLEILPLYNDECDVCSE